MDNLLTDCSLQLRIIGQISLNDNSSWLWTPVQIDGNNKMYNHTCWSMIYPASKQLHLQIHPSDFSLKFGGLITFHYPILSLSWIWLFLSLVIYSWIYNTMFTWCQHLKLCTLRRCSVLLQVIYCPLEFNKLIFSVCGLLFTPTSAEEWFLFFSTFLSYCYTAVTLLMLYFVLVEFS